SVEGWERQRVDDDVAARIDEPDRGGVRGCCHHDFRVPRRRGCNVGYPEVDVPDECRGSLSMLSRDADVNDGNDTVLGRILFLQGKVHFLHAAYGNDPECAGPARVSVTCGVTTGSAVTLFAG